MSVKHQPCEKIQQIDRLLNGNGEKGILEKVDAHETFITENKDVPPMVKDHETFIQQMRGIKIALVAIFGTSLIGAAAAIVSIIKIAQMMK
jgi:hypothetical protein